VTKEEVLRSQYIIRVEVALFALRALESLYDEEQSITNISKVFDLALSFRELETLPNNYIIKSVLQFCCIFAQEFKYNPQLGYKVIEYSFLFLGNKELQGYAAEVFYDTTKQLRQPLPSSAFENLLKEVFLKLETITNQSSIESLISSLLNLSKLFTGEEANKAKTHSLSFVEVGLEKLGTLPNPTSSPLFMGILRATGSAMLSFSQSSNSLEEISPLGNNTNNKVNFIKRNLPKLIILFETYKDEQGLLLQFTYLFESIAEICPLDFFNYAEQLLPSIWKAIQSNPYKYSELLSIFEEVLKKNRDSEFMRSYMSTNLSNICHLFLGYLDGKWEDSDFLLHFVKLLGTILSYCQGLLLKQPDFEAISVRLLKIYAEFNSYEVRRDILKLWYLCFNKGLKNLTMMSSMLRHALQDLLLFTSRTL
jgi:hypothetical protein